ncbi:Gfo/Idh/MocA family protein [Rhizobium paknamense]|uniref:Dehydrogenase n=1 Tax=Rhizobium paknamense TaxID=1206817 RepID=A0ABU0IDW2_9HYPH|nr:Gfo/Idh/MocA family oxidoreductase [Rhizobium paknamense]MDQ0456437.1 putative dehydrogenase [Rhizobium paknamense]
MAKIMKVALVGLGIGQAHIERGYAQNRDILEVAVLCDLDRQRLAQCAERFGVERTTTSYDEVLAMPDIDIVDLCTPPMAHLEMILKALKAGKHVICEKPLVGSLADLDLVMAAEREASARLMPIFQYRFGDGALKAKRIIEAGLAGKPYVATVETHWRREADYYDVAWRGKWATELGGVLMTHAIHQHDMLTFLMGPVARLFGRTATRVNPIEVEDCVSASLLMENGALATLSATLGCAEEISRVRLCYENVTFESNHEAYNPGEDPWRILPARPEIGEQIDALLAGWEPVGNRYIGQFRQFYEALQSGGPLPVTTEDARRSLELVTAFYHSSETGQDVLLPLDASHPKYQSWRPA